MKRASQRLVLRGETLRIVGNMGLARVAGGNESNHEPCTNLNVVESRDKACVNIVGDKRFP